MNKIIEYNSKTDGSVVSAINTIYNSLIASPKMWGATESDITIEISSYTIKNKTVLVANNKHRSEVDVDFNLTITDSFINKSDAILQEKMLKDEINSIKCSVLLSIVPEKWRRVKFVYIGKGHSTLKTTKEKGVDYIINTIKLAYTKCVEKSHYWLEKMFSKSEDQSGVSCSYDGGYYTFPYAIKELTDKGYGYIMYRKGSEAFVELSRTGEFLVFNFKSFDENGRFRRDSSTVKERFVPTQSDLSDIWIVKKKTPLNLYYTDSVDGFEECKRIKHDEEVSRKWVWA